MTSFWCGTSVRGPGPLPAVVPSMVAKHAGVDLLLDRQQIHQSVVDPGVGVMAVDVEQAAKGVLHRPGGDGVAVRLDRGQVDDVLADEEIGHVDAVGKILSSTSILALGL